MPESEGLLGGIVADARELIGGHADRLRAELRSDLRGLRHLIIAAAIGTGAGVMAAFVLCGALVATLWAIGLPLWAAAWIVFVVVGAIAGVMIARVIAARVDDHAVDELKSARDDLAWAGVRAVKAIEGDPAVQAPPPTTSLH